MSQTNSPALLKSKVLAALQALTEARSVEAKVTTALACMDACRYAMGDYPLAHPLAHEYTFVLEPKLARVYTEFELDAFREDLKGFAERVLGRY